jgi:hypothetical protein
VFRVGDAEESGEAEPVVLVGTVSVDRLADGGAAACCAIAGGRLTVWEGVAGGEETEDRAGAAAASS